MPMNHPVPTALTLQDKLKNADAPLIGVLLATLYITCFSLSFRMGLYADDFVISNKWGQSLSDYWTAIKQAALTWPQGRPLIGVQKALFGGGAWALGGLRGVYILGYGVLAGNALMTFFLLRRIAPVSVAFVGAMAMILYPADTAKMTYIRTTQVQFVVLLFLLATWAYLNGHRFLAYLAILWTVGVYETVILLFFFVPALRIPWRRAVLRDFLKHGAILGALLAGVVVLRLALAPAYLGEVSTALGPWETVWRAFLAVVLGTATSAKLLVLRVVTALQTLSWLSAAVMLAVGAATALVLGRTLNLKKKDDSAGGAASMSWSPLTWPRPLQLICVGAVLWLAAYPLFFTTLRFPPTAIVGRPTSPHAAAEIGVSLVLAGGFWALIHHWRRRGAQRAIIAGVALYFGLLAGFQITVQSELAKAWQIQKAFWQALVRAVPDLEPNMVIIVDPRHGTWGKTRYAEIYPWNLQHILPQTLTAKAGRKAVPRAVWIWQILPRTFFKVTFLPRNNVTVKYFLDPKPRRNMKNKIVWLVANQNGGFDRITSPKIVQGVTIHPKPLGPSTLDTWGKGPLYAPLLED